MKSVDELLPLDLAFVLESSFRVNKVMSLTYKEFLILQAFINEIRQGEHEVNLAAIVDRRISYWCELLGMQKSQVSLAFTELERRKIMERIRMGGGKNISYRFKREFAEELIDAKEKQKKERL